MESINSKKILMILTLFIIIFVSLLKMFSCYLNYYGLLYNYDSINPAIPLFISFPILFIIYIKNKINKKLDIFDYLFIVFMITGLLTVLFSINKYIAIFGKEFRHEGFLSLATYYLLLINWKDNAKKDDIKIIIKVLIVFGIVSSIYALLQMYTNFPFIIRRYAVSHGTRMASGLSFNPNFFGSLIVTLLAIVMSKILLSPKINKCDMIIFILFTISLINCNSTGPLLTIILVYIFLLIIFKIKKIFCLKKFILVLLALILTYIGVYFININTGSKTELTKESIKYTIKTGASGRLDIWKKTFKVIEKNPITGVGFDNFDKAYPNPKISSPIKINITSNLDNKKIKKKSVEICDNAHNVYLHILAVSGILGFIPYMLLCLLVFLKGLKSEDKSLLIIYSGFVSYSIQAFANISVVQVAPVYYILMGMILSLDKMNDKITIDK